jgi:hypothetical protein
MVMFACAHRVAVTIIATLTAAAAARGQCGAASLGSVDTPGEAYDIAISGPGSANGVAVVGTIAYVADGSVGGFRVIDVSDPASPSTLGFVNTPSSALDVVLSGTMAYVAGGLAGLHVIDVSDPANPSILGTANTLDQARGVAVSGTMAYVADNLFGMQMIDVSDPGSPTILGGINTPGLAADVAVSGTLVHVADSSGGLQVVDMSDPANPAIVCSQSTTGQARGVAVSGAIAYVANNLAGLLVVGVTPGVFGACCLGETCLEVMTEANCLAVGGVYVEDGDCAACIGPLVSDDCSDALAIADGDTAFSTIDATTDGPPLPMSCDEDSNLTLVDDVWFAYTPTSSGTLTVSTCNQASYDTRLAAYTGACGALELIACNDDGPACSQFTSIMEVPVTLGTLVRLRVGGLGVTGTSVRCRRSRPSGSVDRCP